MRKQSAKCNQENAARGSRARDEEKNARLRAMLPLDPRPRPSFPAHVKNVADNPRGPGVLSGMFRRCGIFSICLVTLRLSGFAANDPELLTLAEMAGAAKVDTLTVP